MITAYLVTCFCIIAATLYYCLQRRYNYWKDRKIPYVKPTSLLFGNYYDDITLKKNLGQMTQAICQELPCEPLVGAFFGIVPVLIPQDPEMIKLITTKDFYYFNGREVSDYTKKEVLTRSLFFTHGSDWKVLRQNLTPLFSSAKMKNIFHLIEKCANELESLMESETKESNVQEVRSLMARYTMDCISSCAFGVNSGVMGCKSKNNPFQEMADTIFESSPIRLTFSRLRSIWPALFYGLGLKVFPDKLNHFFSQMLTSVMTERNHEPSQRNDFIDLMLILKRNSYITGDKLVSPTEVNKEKIEIKIDDDLLVGQSQIFFAAGFETSASTLSYTLFELAKSKRCQNLVRQEVLAYLTARNGIIDYDCVSELPYLDQCVEEALRLYPILDIVTRDVRDTYVLPNGAKLDKGVKVHIPVYHMHHHPEFFPEPETFRPERFSPEERKHIKPYTYMPFGEGARICIGMRFAKMQMIPGLITILKSYQVELADGMPSKLEFSTTAPVLQTTTGINLHFKKL